VSGEMKLGRRRINYCAAFLKAQKEILLFLCACPLGYPISVLWTSDYVIKKRYLFS